MSDLSYLVDNFDTMSRQMKVSKVYLETHRNMVVADEAVIRRAKEISRVAAFRYPGASRSP